MEQSSFGMHVFPDLTNVCNFERDTSFFVSSFTSFIPNASRIGNTLNVYNRFVKLSASPLMYFGRVLHGFT